MQIGTRVRVTSPYRIEDGQAGVVVGTYGMTGIRVQLPGDADGQSSVFVASELVEDTMKAGDRVTVVDRTNQFYGRSGAIQREAYSQIFILFDGEPNVTPLPFTAAQLAAVPDSRRGGQAIGRFKR